LAFLVSLKSVTLMLSLVALSKSSAQ
jgi:hypothetical protein